MNSKKLLSMLLVSLGAFSLVLTGCEKKNSDSSSVEPSTEPSTTPSEKPSEKPSESPSETASETPSDTTSVEESTTPSESASESSGIDLPETTTYDVTFNYDEPKSNLTVWTDFAIDQTIAPITENISENPDVDNMHTTPLTMEGSTACGMYYFAVDANGYIIYASYGLGVGYGSPSDGYYHNQETKDIFEAPYWSLHTKFQPWSSGLAPVEVNGKLVNPWTLYDFIIPEGGFVVKGYYNEANMKSFWKVLTSQTVCPTSTNNTLENTTKPGALDKFYVSINEDHQLSIRERMDNEKVVDGEQEEETPAQNFTATDADNPVVYTKIAGIEALENNAEVSKVKGVITYLSNGTAIIEDEEGSAIMVYDNALKEGYAVGETISVDGVKATYGGYAEIKSLTAIEKVEKYGSVAKVSPILVNEENVEEVWTEENNYKLFKLEKAEVMSIVASGTSTVKVGETEISLFKVSFPETVAVGDYVDVLCSMQCYNGAVQGRVAQTSDVSRYYNVTVDVDGEEGALEPVVTPHATGDVVELVAENSDTRYQFSHWEKKVVGEDGEESWEEVATTIEYEITVGEADEEYRAVFTYAAWTLLPENMGLAYNEPADSVNADAGADAFAVVTEGVFHENGAWTSGLYNTSWRLIIVVDGEGKIAYITHNPANGYGGPNGTGYYAHPDYANDYENNPAFNILEGYGPWTKEDATASTKFEIVVPEGGFMITAAGTDAAAIMSALTNGEVTVVSDVTTGTINSRNCPIDENTRVFYDGLNNAVRVYVPSVEEGNYLVTLNKNGYGTSSQIGVFVDDESNPLVSEKAEGRYKFDNANGWRYCFAVNAEGRIIYASYGLGAGYGSPADDFYSDGTFGKSTSANKGTVVGDFFALGENYAAWAEWNASTDPNKDELYNYGDYEALVPEGGFVVTGHNGDANMNALWSEIFGPELAADGAELLIDTTAAGTFNDVTVELVYVNGVAQLKVTGGHGWVDPNLPTVEELKSMEGYTVAPYGTEEGDIYADLTVTENGIVATGATLPSKAHIYDEVGAVVVAEVTATETGYTVAVADFDYQTAYYVVQEWTVGEVNYKSIAYHAAGEGTSLVTNDNLIAQVGQSLSFVSNADVGNGSLQWDSYKGVYYGQIVLGQWRNVTFTYTDAEGTETLIWYDTATVTGLVTAADAGGADWTKNLYHEGDLKAFYTCTGGTYTFSFDPATMTLVVA